MSQIPFEDETLDASDGVTKLLLAAECWKEKASALRAELDALKRQEPVAWMKDQWSPDCGIYWELCREDEMGWRDRKDRVPLYLAPGAQPALIEQDTSVRKAWARFSNELHRSPDAPYPGMADAFEQHFSQSFTDREWRAESGTWAAAWKAAKNHGAQPAPSVPEDVMRDVERYRYLRARDDETAGVGCWIEAEGRVCDRGWLYGVQLDSAIDSFIEMLAATPEAKP